MNKKPILIVAGEPYSIFSEIFFKSYKKIIFLKDLWFNSFKKNIFETDEKIRLQLPI